jgi:hypothetical protein
MFVRSAAAEHSGVSLSSVVESFPPTRDANLCQRIGLSVIPATPSARLIPTCPSTDSGLQRNGPARSSHENIRAQADAKGDVAAGANKATGERSCGYVGGARQNRPHHDPAGGHAEVQTQAVDDAVIILCPASVRSELAAERWRDPMIRRCP